MRERLPGLDLLRIVAIGLVFLRHLPVTGSPPFFQGVLSFGWIGVDLFFVLSAYLVVSQVIVSLKKTNSVEPKVFYLKRVLRILPLYWVVLAAYFCLPQLRETPQLSSFWSYFCFVQNFGLNLGQSGGFSHAWSLCVEEQFYLLLPGLCWMFYRWSSTWPTIAALTVSWLLCIALRVWLWGEHDLGEQPLLFLELIYFPSYTRLDPFVVGAGLALIDQLRPAVWQVFQSLRYWLLAFGVIAVDLGVLCCQPMRCFSATTLGLPLLAVGFGALVVWGTTVQWSWPRSCKALGLAADCTYAVYLTHVMCIHIAGLWCAQLSLEPRGPAFYAMATGLTIAVGLAMTLLVGQPFLALRRRWIAKLRAD